MPDFGHIVEIREVGLRAANELLSHGYQLLACDITTRYARYPEPEQGYWLRSDFTYVVGRTADVAHHDVPLKPNDVVKKTGVEVSA